MKKAFALLICPVALHAQLPPPNPYLIDSPFPAIHNGSYRQGNTLENGLRPGDTIDIDFAHTPRDHVSPWLLYSEAYPDGSRTFWGSTSTHIFKGVSTRKEFRVVSSFRIDFNPMMNDLSWSLLMLPGHRCLTYDDNSLLLFGEADPRDPYSDIVLLRKIEIGGGVSTVSKLCQLYDGSIAFASDKGMLGILRGDDFSLTATWQIPLRRGEIAYHNDYAADENGNLFLSTSRKMLCVRWDGKTLKPVWEVSMDFGGNRFQGVGTTPTLLGQGNGDRLVCVVDSQTPARMLVFWRDEIPGDWAGLPGQDRRIAAIVALPGASPPNRINAAVENSPAAYGYDIACAQYNGFLGQTTNTRKGSQQVALASGEEPDEAGLAAGRHQSEQRARLQYSRERSLWIGAGRETDGNYCYYTLDWESGRTLRKDVLGDSPRFDDPGNANLIGPDRGIIFNSKKGLVRLRPR